MSMLAEPKRKKAWILNPRGSQWSEDDNKMGQKMLEQMGWSKGKGLGKTLAGITEHIRPSVQNDSRGLGFEGNADEWTSHLDDFNDLLAKLHQDQEGGSAASVRPKKQLTSLEQSSKKSRARVHYHKFTRGKDLSRASSQDLACILGGRAESAASQPVTPVSSRPPSPPPHADSDPEPEPEPDAGRPEVDKSSGYTTIHTGQSVQAYFAEKMRKMKLLKLKHQRDQEETPAGVSPQVQPEATPADDNVSGSPRAEERQSGKTKKKRKRSDLDQEQKLSPDQDKSSDRGDIDDPAPRKKKEKTKVEAEDGVNMGLSINAPDVEGSCETKKKKKSKKRRTELCDETVAPVDIESETSEKKKKKKKRKREADADDS